MHIQIGPSYERYHHERSKNVTYVCINYNPLCTAVCSGELFFSRQSAGNGASSTASRFVSNSPEQTAVLCYNTTWTNRMHILNQISSMGIPCFFYFSKMQFFFTEKFTVILHQDICSRVT